MITYDAGINFAADEFKKELRIIGISYDQVPVEAH